MAQYPRPNLGRSYDAGTEVTLQGQISRIHADGGEKPVACTLDVEANNILVETGPAWFLVKQSFELLEGHEVIVIGSLVPHKESYAMVAREIHLNGRRLFLREPCGSPLWKHARCV